MIAFRHVLCPIDFTPGTPDVIEHTLFLARQFGADVELLHVTRPRSVWDLTPTIGPVSTLPEFASTFAGEMMRDYLAVFEKHSVSARGRLESGDPLDVIRSLAENNHYDLIVMGTHGRTGMSHLLLGSVAERVVREATCPVMTVHLPPDQPLITVEDQPDVRT